MIKLDKSLYSIFDSIIQNIHILINESLMNDMKNLGYDDLHLWTFKTPILNS
jgi:hypothetical protein